MDKRVIFAVAGAGKTSHILKQLKCDSRSLIITYTNNNIKNLKTGIIEKFGFIPNNIRLLSYFTFLYSFCFKPFLSFKYRTKGINYNLNCSRYIKQTDLKYYYDKNNRIYSNRISKFIEENNESINVKNRLEKYYDNLYIDEIQDLGGNDFNFLKIIAQSNLNILLVGDFYQHTFDTSRDGNVNKSIHKDFVKYKTLFVNMGLTVDTVTLDKSWRCSPSVCKFITDNLGIKIKSHNKNGTKVTIIKDKQLFNDIIRNNNIIKLFYQKHDKYKCFSQNWGQSKGENHYSDICIVLNNTTLDNFEDLTKLQPMTKNKLYVACSRANNNLYFVSDKFFKEMK